MFHSVELGLILLCAVLEREKNRAKIVHAKRQEGRGCAALNR